jgi:dienelactone hydrolase
MAGVGLTLMLMGLAWLLLADRGLITTEVELEQAPVSISMLANTEHAPLVVIAHGFSGSRQMMASIARTLARNGYVAVSFDFPGHGANALPLEGKIGEPQRTQALLDALAAVVDYASGLPAYDGRLALLGHSMAGDIAVRYANADSGNETAAELDALVAVSPYLAQEIGAHVEGETPNNLLFIYGEWEPQMILDQGRAAVAAVAQQSGTQQSGTEPSGAEIEPGVTYGDHADGSARRLVIADDVEHIGVLYSASAIKAALDWLNQVFGPQGSGWIDARGLWLGLYFLGVLLLAWPLSRLLPRVSSRPLGAGLDWRRLLPAALIPALLTPLVLRPFPSDFLSIAIADYIALHFAVYALLTGLILLLLRRQRGLGSGLGSGRAVSAAGRLGDDQRAAISAPAFIAALLAVIAYQTLAIAVPTDLYIAAFLPDPHRLGILALMFCATVAWFLADEWLTRGPGAFIGGYALTKVLFLVSLMLAVVLNLDELFFLVIIIPAILILFVVFGLFSAWVYRRTGHPWIAALANALAFALAITVSFPIAD